MKIAFCLFKYFPFGGLQSDFLRIARECVRRGHQIDVYTMQWEGEREAGLNVHLIPVTGWQNHTRICSYVAQLQPLLKSKQYDLVVGFNKMPGLDIYYAADVCYQSRKYSKFANWLLQMLPRYRQLFAYEKAVFDSSAKTKILLISPTQQQAYSQFYQTPAERFHLLPPGIKRDRAATDNAVMIRAETRRMLGLSDDMQMLLMVGSGFKTKGVDRSIKALAALPNTLRQQCRLFVIGQGDSSYYQRLACKQNVAEQVIFLGGRSDVPAFLLAADLLLHPARHENTGTVLLEALAAGLPVLTVDVCGYAHYVTAAHAGCVVASPFNQTRFNQALVDSTQATEKNNWRTNALRFAKQADIYSMPEKAVDYIDNVAASEFASYFSPDKSLFEQINELKGEIFRDVPGRLTQRVQIGNQHYFLKQHHGIGWKEFFKNILQGRWPVFGAKDEYLAINKLQALGVNTPAIASYGVRGLNPVTRQSYILLKELAPTISLEDLAKQWQTQPPSFHFKQALIRKVADIAAKLHQNGMNHRDFYICHFLLQHQDPDQLYLIDLHRAQIRKTTPIRWIIKDVAGLYFSSKGNMTLRDMLRFMQIYSGKSWREELKNNGAFWEKIKLRGERLYRDHYPTS